MSVTGPAQSAVDWVNPVNWGPWGPLAGALGWPQACHVGGRRRSNAGDQTHGGAAREGYGFHVPGGLRGRGWARSTRLGVARPTAVVGGAGTAGDDRYELAGGEVLRVPDGSCVRARERPN